MEKILSNYKSLLNNLEALSSESINNYDLDKTGLFIVDMNNGFAKEGALSSPRVEKIISNFFLCNYISHIIPPQNI